MRDPYDILGVARGASFDDVRSAYRRACKTKHPDMGGSHEAMVELNTAYAFILDDLKRGYQQRSREAPKQESAASTGERGQRNWEQTYRDIDEELEQMRRSAQAHEEALRAMRNQAWQSGDRVSWAKLTWEDFAHFVSGLARSGLKGLAVLFAAIVGIGSVLVEANLISALILVGAGIGFLFSLALKSDKGGIMSVALLLFGVMTIWVPLVRGALFVHPLATISVLVLLALIFRFAQAGGAVGLMTGGVLALYVIGVIVNDTAPQSEQVVVRPVTAVTPTVPAPQVASAQTPSRSTTASASAPPLETTAVEPPPTPPEPRTLLASSPGALLKFVAGVPYHLKVRTGFTTSLRATQGRVALSSSTDDRAGQCVDALELPMRSGSAPYQEIDHLLRACGADAVMTVSAVR
jgi:hypothetical protein